MKLREEARELLYLLFQLVVVLLTMIMFMNLAKGDERQKTEKTIRHLAAVHGVEPELAVAIAQVESGLNKNAVGSLGEVGLFQLRPEFHPVSAENEAANIETAMKYLVSLRATCSRYGDAYFICFNLGPAKQIRFPHRFPYYQKVMNAKRQLAGEKI